MAQNNFQSALQVQKVNVSTAVVAAPVNTENVDTPVICNDKCKQICTPGCFKSIPAPLSLISVCSGIMVSIHLALSTQSSMGLELSDDNTSYSNHKGMQLSILVFACLTFMVIATTLALIKPEFQMGHILLQRIMKTQDNWSKETLRSFIELWMWMCVNWCTYGVTGSVAISVACGTLAGIFSVLVGEYLSIPMQAAETYLREVISDRTSEEGTYFFTSGSMMVVVLYGYSIFTLIYENVVDILLSTFIVATAGALLLILAKVLAMFPPTARAGILLSRRIIEAPDNWKNHTMRSLLEASAWMSITLSNFAAYGDVIFAFQVGTLGGILICLGGEYLTPRLNTSHIPNLELTYWWRTNSEEEETATATTAAATAATDTTATDATATDATATDTTATATTTTNAPPSAAALDYSVMLTFTYTMGATLLLISGNKGFHWSMALLLSTLTGMAYIIAGKLFLSVPATHFIGTVLLDRFLSTRSNWEQHTDRSMMETSIWLLATSAAWKYSDGSFIFTIPFGTSMGIVVVLLSTVFGWGSALIWKESPTDGTSTTTILPPFPFLSPPSTKHEKTMTNNKQTKLSHRHTIYEWSDVSKHCSRNDCWIVIHGIVYDVTKWGPKHPGGSIIYKYGGKDCSDQFEAFHRSNVKTRLSAYKIGVMSVNANEELLQKTSKATLAYRKLRSNLWKNGHFNANQTYFYWKHAVWVSLVLSSIIIICMHTYYPSILSSICTNAKLPTTTTPPPPPSSLPTWQISLVAGILLGLGWQQAAFVAHDAAHNGIVPPKKGGGINWLGWFLASPIFGISSSLWTEEHNQEKIHNLIIYHYG
jgi:cytochrome b involved in lipid metabolism